MLLGLLLLIAAPAGLFFMTERAIVQPIRDQASVDFSQCDRPGFPLLTAECETQLIESVEGRIDEAGQNVMIATGVATLVCWTLFAILFRRRRRLVAEGQ